MDGLRSKHVSEFLGKAAVRYAIIVCARAAAACPRIYPFAGRTLSWPFDDPAARRGPEEERIAAFRAVRDGLIERIDRWVVDAR